MHFSKWGHVKAASVKALRAAPHAGPERGASTCRRREYLGEASGPSAAER